MPEPHPDLFPQLVRSLKQWNELARTLRQFAVADAFKAMSRQSGPEDVEPLLDEVLELWQEVRRNKVWELADGIRFGLQRLPGIAIEDRPGRPPHWRFRDGQSRR